jgi:hypothetical protein
VIGVTARRPDRYWKVSGSAPSAAETLDRVIILLGLRIVAMADTMRNEALIPRPVALRLNPSPKILSADGTPEISNARRVGRFARAVSICECSRCWWRLKETSLC